jgi:hypothetical protein
MLPQTNVDAAAKEFLSLPLEERERLELLARGLKVAALPISVEGFSHFFWCVFRYEVAPYAKEKWADELVKAYINKTGVILEGFRGATKSTFIFAWNLYVTGKNPVGNSVLVRINDAAAAETGKASAEIIENSPAWKACFPHVIPDKDRGWSTDGWYLRDDREERGSWVEKTIADHLGEPSILMAGITSGIHIGKHPTNGWYFDDFHDDQNTRSTREMKNIVDTIEKNIVPTWTRPGKGHPVLAGACTFWDEGDGYHSLLRTGLFKHTRVPIFELDDTSNIIYPGIAHHGARIRLAWPEAYPLEKIVEIERRDPVWFPVMYLCNLEALKGTVLKKEWLRRYKGEIDPSWPTYFGVDFASSDDKVGERDRDYFTLAVGAGLPQGGIVIIDGLRGKFPSADSMGHLKAFASKYPTLVTIGLEKWGKGETFKDMLLYNTTLPIVPCPFAGTPVKSKGQRYQAEGGLAPMFVDGRIWIADQPQGGDFVPEFEKEWISWDGRRTKTGHDDCLDAVYWMAYIAQSHLVPYAPSQSMRTPERKASPFTSLARN